MTTTTIKPLPFAEVATLMRQRFDSGEYWFIYDPDNVGLLALVQDYCMTQQNIKHFELITGFSPQVGAWAIAMAHKAYLSAQQLHELMRPYVAPNLLPSVESLQSNNVLTTMRHSKAHWGLMQKIFGRERCPTTWEEGGHHHAQD